jgi:hypothetical protein
MDKTILREKIQKIRESQTLSDKEKNIEIFNLLNSNHSVNNINNSVNENIKCNHYTRKCLIRAPCCDKIFPCRLCHNENSDHEINRYDIKKIICIECNTEQDCSNKCIKCNIQFANYYCDICHLWEDNLDKKIFHCDKCKICRVGGKENFFHCDKCNLCLSINLKDNHKCVENTANSNCPCCNENLFSSTMALSVLDCGHSIHKECLSKYLQYNYNCPLCKKSIGDLSNYWSMIDNFLQNQEMPDEYKDKKSKIYCNDCEEQSEVKFHFIYHKCLNCNSYNTNVI